MIQHQLVKWDSFLLLFLLHGHTIVGMYFWDGKLQFIRTICRQLDGYDVMSDKMALVVCPLKLSKVVAAGKSWILTDKEYNNLIDVAFYCDFILKDVWWNRRKGGFWSFDSFMNSVDFGGIQGRLVFWGFWGFIWTSVGLVIFGVPYIATIWKSNLWVTFGCLSLV